MKKILALVLAALMVLSMVACAKTETKGEQITLTIWAPQEDQVDENSWLQTMLKKFEAAHPEYNIKWELGVCSEGDAATKVTTDVSAAADVFMYANDQLGTLLAAEALAKLGGNYATQVKTDNPQSIVDSVTYTDGELYGFPYTNNTWYMFYNTNTYSAEDVKSMETMLEKGHVAFEITNAWYVWSFFAGAGGTLFGANGLDADAGIVLGDKGTAVTEAMINMVNHENFVVDGDKKGIAGLKDGTIDAVFTGSWDAALIKQNLGDKMGVATPPTINVDGTASQMKAFAGSKALGVNRQSKNMKVALEVAAFLSSEEAQLAHFEMRGIIPCATKLAENDKIKADPVAVGEILTMANASCVQPTITEMSRFWDPAAKHGTAIKDGKTTLDNADVATEQLEAALNNSGL